MSCCLYLASFRPTKPASCNRWLYLSLLHLCLCRVMTCAAFGAPPEPSHQIIRDERPSDELKTPSSALFFSSPSLHADFLASANRGRRSRLWMRGRRGRTSSLGGWRRFSLCHSWEGRVERVEGVRKGRWRGAWGEEVIQWDTEGRGSARATPHRAGNLSIPLFVWEALKPTSSRFPLQERFFIFLKTIQIVLILDPVFEWNDDLLHPLTGSIFHLCSLRCSCRRGNRLVCRCDAGAAEVVASWALRGHGEERGACLAVATIGGEGDWLGCFCQLQPLAEVSASDSQANKGNPGFWFFDFCWFTWTSWTSIFSRIGFTSRPSTVLSRGCSRHSLSLKSGRGPNSISVGMTDLCTSELHTCWF